MALLELYRILRIHFQLLLELTKREIADRFIGQAFGIIWTVVHPIFFMVLYVFIFTVVFKSRLNMTLDYPVDYTIYILSGLIPWLACQEVLSRSVVAITSSANLVKQVVFPIEILPARAVLSSMWPQLVCTGILIFYTFILIMTLPATYFLLPLLIFFQLLGLLGIAFFLAAAGAFLRDLKDIIQIVSQVLIFISPILYLPDMVPPNLRFILWLNPVSYMVWCFQDVCVFTQIMHPIAWVVFPSMCLFSLYVGYKFFRRVKFFFGNVL